MLEKDCRYQSRLEVAKNYKTARFGFGAFVPQSVHHCAFSHRRAFPPQASMRNSAMVAGSVFTVSTVSQGVAPTFCVDSNQIPSIIPVSYCNSFGKPENTFGSSYYNYPKFSQEKNTFFSIFFRPCLTDPRLSALYRPGFDLALRHHP